MAGALYFYTRNARYIILLLSSTAGRHIHTPLLQMVEDPGTLPERRSCATFHSSSSWCRESRARAASQRPSADTSSAWMLVVGPRAAPAFNGGLNAQSMCGKCSRTDSRAVFFGAWERMCMLGQQAAPIDGFRRLSEDTMLPLA